MKKVLWGLLGLFICATLGALPASAQVKQTREQILFYTSTWKGERFPDGRPKIPDDLVKRARSMTIEDLWDFLVKHGYNEQWEGDWEALHDTNTMPIVGRALTAQYMPTRPDMKDSILAEGKAEGRVLGMGLGTNSWPIAELSADDVYVADGYGKVQGGSLMGSNLANGIAGHTHGGVIFYGGIRDQKECQEIPNFNAMYKGHSPTTGFDIELTGINVPVRIGQAIVLPGDLVLGMPGDGVLFVPAILAEQAVSSAEFTSLTDEFNFELNKEGKNGGQFEGGWNAAKYDAFAKWIDANPSKLKMPRSEFDQLLSEQPSRGSMQ